MVLIYSATKGLAAMTLAIAHSRGWLDYDERVCTYSPAIPPARGFHDECLKIDLRFSLGFMKPGPSFYR